MLEAIKSLFTRDRQSHEKGLTLIEFVVVAAMIATLAAIFAPNFIAQRDRAHDSAVQSDMRNAALAAETNYIDALTYYIEDDVLGTFATSDDGVPAASDGHIGYGVTFPDDADLGGTGQSYIIYGESISGTVFKFESATGGMTSSEDDEDIVGEWQNDVDANHRWGDITEN